MRFLKTYKIFEVNLRDVATITKDFDEYFTISFEFEIETGDAENIKVDFSEFDRDSVEEVISIIKTDLAIRKKVEKDFVEELCYLVLDHIISDDFDLKTFDEIFTNTPVVNERQKEILNHTKSVIISFISSDDLEFLKSKVFEYLPRFTENWSDRMEFIGDATLDRGIEIKPKTYVNSISEAIQLLNDFFRDLKGQDYWKFTEKTGLHINIGTKSESNWNPIKGLLLLNDFSKSENTPYVFKDMEWRWTNKFCGSMLPQISKLPEREKQALKRKCDLGDINSTESILNQFLDRKVNIWGIKNLGFNISKLSSNYVEFRYVGCEVEESVVIDKLKYFAFIVYAMTNPNYKRNEYLKKLYKFIDGL